MFKRILVFIVFLVLVLPFTIIGQETEKKKDYGIKFKGFVKTDFWGDTRKVADAREGIFALFPLDKNYDVNGNDLHAKKNLNFSAMTSRLTGVIKGKDAFGAKTSGVIEADFSGTSNNDNNGFRLRIAMGKLSWKKDEFLFGQFWHPMFVTDVFPRVISLNTGAPFQAFIRNPQLRYTRTEGNLKLIFALLSQRDYSTKGYLEIGRSSVYMRNAVIPNGHFQIKYKTNKHFYGIAADYKFIQPRIKTEKDIITNSRLGTYAFMAYYKYTYSKRFCLKAKAMYGQNLTEHLLLGGYAVQYKDTVTGIETYTPTNHIFSWVNFTYGDDIKVGLFGGFAQNLGTTDENIGVYYATGSNMKYLYRIAPNISFISGKFQISSELEYTVAAYGTPDLKGIVKDVGEVANIRLLFTMFYFF